MTDYWTDFIPGTMEREIAPNIVFRPIRSWHSATYAGERLRKVGNDGSGCMRLDNDDTKICNIPLTVTHRCYWNKQTGKRLSVFLSYPEGMGYFGDKQYFWEAYPVGDDVERYETEDEMERSVIGLLSVGGE